MSIHNNIFGRLYAELHESLYRAYDLLLPSYCVVCKRRKAERSNPLCPACQSDIPLTHFAHIPDNPMKLHVESKFEEIRHASALIYYYSMGDECGGEWREMIHRLKYRGEHHLGRIVGEMLGRELSLSPLYSDIDFVVAIPLHPLRQIYRGYNQSHYIARGVAKMLHVPYRHGVLRRKRYNTSQVKVDHDKRWENTKDLFEVVSLEAFTGKSVLIIDDVFTTGATTISCARSIISVAPTCRIYIAAVALSSTRFEV